MATSDPSLFQFCYSRKNDLNLGDIIGSTEKDEAQLSKFDICLQEKWKSAMEKGYFRYNLDGVQTKVIPGKYKYVAQLNVQRATNRRPPEFITSVKESFDKEKFNFTKIPLKEILFEVYPKEGLKSDKINHECKSKHQVVINVSPIEMGHVLLVPFINQCLPQILTVSSLALALDMVLLSNHRGFRVGWNSLCAFASVNHLHFHALYLDYKILMDDMAVSSICNNIYETIDIKSRGFAFQLDDHDSTDELARLVCQITTYFTENEIAHNLTITRGKDFRSPNKTTLRVLLWPKEAIYGAKKYSEFVVSCYEPAGFLLLKGLCGDCFNCAAYEMGGHLPIKEKEAYDSMTEQKANTILENFSFSEIDFNELKYNIVNLVSTN